MVILHMAFCVFEHIYTHIPMFRFVWSLIIILLCTIKTIQPTQAVVELGRYSFNFKCVSIDSGNNLQFTRKDVGQLVLI